MQEVMLVFPAGELITVEQVIRDLTMKGQKLLGMSQVLRWQSETVREQYHDKIWRRKEHVETKGNHWKSTHQVFISSPFFLLLFFYPLIVSLLYLFIITFLRGEGTKLIWASHILTGSLTLFWLLDQLHLHGNKLGGLDSCFPTNSSSQSLVILVILHNQQSKRLRRA